MMGILLAARPAFSMLIPTISYLVGSTLVVALICVLREWFEGPNCKTYLYTRNHTEPLLRLYRYKEALRAMEEINERIVADQHSPVAPTNPDASFHFQPPAPPEPEPTFATHSKRQEAYMKGAFYTAQFFVVLELLDLLFGIMTPPYFRFMIYSLISVFAGISIAQSHGSACPPLARIMAIVLLSVSVLLVPLTIIISTIANGYGYLGDGISFASLRLSTGTSYSATIAFGMTYCVTFAIASTVGLSSLFRTRKRSDGELL